MSDLSASRPTRLMSSPWPAIPTTSVAKMSGAISDLIIRRKMVERGLSCCDASGNAHPTSVPTTIANRIHWVSERVRRKVSIARDRVEVADSVGTLLCARVVSGDVTEPPLDAGVGHAEPLPLGVPLGPGTGLGAHHSQVAAVVERVPQPGIQERE